MSDNVMVNVAPTFDVGGLADQLTEKYRMDGYTVSTVRLRNAYSLSFSKNNSGLRKFLGLGEHLKLNIGLRNDVLSASYTDINWTNKIIAIVLGFSFAITLLGIPLLICGIIGISRQSNLPSNISEDVVMMTSDLDAPPVQNSAGVQSTGQQ